MSNTLLGSIVSTIALHFNHRTLWFRSYTSLILKFLNSEFQFLNYDCTLAGKKAADEHDVQTDSSYETYLLSAVSCYLSPTDILYTKKRAVLVFVFHPKSPLS